MTRCSRERSAASAEAIEGPLEREIPYLDKLADELAKGRTMEDPAQTGACNSVMPAQAGLHAIARISSEARGSSGSQPPLG